MCGGTFEGPSDKAKGEESELAASPSSVPRSEETVVLGSGPAGEDDGAPPGQPAEHLDVEDALACLPAHVLRWVCSDWVNASPMPAVAVCRTWADVWRGQSLDLCRRRYTTRELARCFAHPGLFSVRSLHLHPKQVDIPRLLALPAFGSLLSLQLSNAGIESLPCVPHLQELHLAWCVSLKALALSPLLEVLDLRTCPLAEWSAAIAPCTNLREVHLVHMAVTDLAPLEAKSGVRTLDLAENPELRSLVPLQAFELEDLTVDQTAVDFLCC